MKNFLANAQAMVRLSSVEGRTAEEFRDEFLDRFASMVRSSDLAFSEEPVTIGGLIETTLEPYAGRGSVVMQGDTNFDPGPTIFQALSLVLYELATNAAKYGALSVPEGKVEVHVSVDLDHGALSLNWKERGGPAAVEPARRGYGSKLIASSIGHTLGGRQEQTFGPDGFSIELTVPLSMQDEDNDDNRSGCGR